MNFQENSSNGRRNTAENVFFSKGVKFQENLSMVSQDMYKGVMCSYQIITPQNALNYHLLKEATDIFSELIFITF
jgi:hypothetical protein